MRAARVMYRFILAKFEGSPVLSNLIADVRKEEIDLTNGLTVSIFPCSFRAVRGFAVPVAILDELAFFRVEGINVDKEVIDALRPAQATFPRSKLVKISSPYVLVETSLFGTPVGPERFPDDVLSIRPYQFGGGGKKLWRFFGSYY